METVPVLYHLGRCWWEVSSDREETRAEKALRERLLTPPVCRVTDVGFPVPLACPLMDDDGGISSEISSPFRPTINKSAFQTVSTEPIIFLLSRRPFGIRQTPSSRFSPDSIGQLRAHTGVTVQLQYCGSLTLSISPTTASF